VNSLGVSPGVKEAPPLRVFGDALLDHQMPSMADLYASSSTAEGRAYWTREVVLLIEEILLGEAGARTGPDLVRLREAEEQLRRARDNESRVDARLSDLKQAAGAVIDVVSLTPDQLVRHIVEQQQLAVQLTLLVEEIGGAARQVEAAERLVDEASRATTPIPDELTDDQIAQMYANPARLEDEGEMDLPVIRQFATPPEFIEVFGNERLKPSTLRRWLSGKLRHGDGDPRNLFQLDAIEVKSAHRRRIRLDKLDWSRFPPQIQERLDAIRREPAPKGWDEGTWLSLREWQALETGLIAEEQAS
jgi:hypothetical protein